MSDQEIGKKMVEREELDYFLEAYEWATGERLSLVGEGESPDFICQRPDGTNVGVELTKVMGDPNMAALTDDEALEMSWIMAEVKAYKKTKNQWPYGDRTILVLQLTDCSLTQLDPFLDSVWIKDLAPLGFLEVWLADFTGIDAYGDIELFGLYPKKWWGYHRRPNSHRKPYG